MALTAKKVYAILKRQISDMEAKIKTPIIYRGTVATADLLPLNPDIGDMYNIESKSIYGEAGMNVAWNGVVWDTMGAPIDMSLYIKSSELSDWVKQQTKPTYTAEEVGALPADTKIPSKTSDLQNDSGFLTKIPDNYLSGTDKTLNVSGKAADAKATGDKITELSADISNKLNKNQGSENSGKIAGINESGDIVPMFPVSVDYNEETNCLEFGSDQKMELNKGINLDNTLTKTGYAADAGTVGEITNSLKEDFTNITSTSNVDGIDLPDTAIVNNQLATLVGRSTAIFPCMPNTDYHIIKPKSTSFGVALLNDVIRYGAKTSERIDAEGESFTINTGDNCAIAIQYAKSLDEKYIFNSISVHCNKNELPTNDYRQKKGFTNGVFGNCQDSTLSYKAVVCNGYKYINACSTSENYSTHFDFFNGHDHIQTIWQDTPTSLVTIPESATHCYVSFWGLTAPVVDPENVSILRFSPIAQYTKTINVLNCGADPTGEADSSTAFNYAIHYAQLLIKATTHFGADTTADGYKIYIPAGNYLIEHPIKVTTTNKVITSSQTLYNGIEFYGDGESTVLNFNNTESNFDIYGGGINIHDMKLINSATSAVLTHGLNAPYSKFKNLTICNSLNGIELNGGYLLILESIHCNNITEIAFKLQRFYTSTVITNCYADICTTGYYIGKLASDLSIVYSAMIGCACDKCNVAYKFNSGANISLYNCGSEAINNCSFEIDSNSHIGIYGFNLIGNNAFINFIGDNANVTVSSFAALNRTTNVSAITGSNTNCISCNDNSLNTVAISDIYPVAGFQSLLKDVTGTGTVCTLGNSVGASAFIIIKSRISTEMLIGVITYNSLNVILNTFTSVTFSMTNDKVIGTTATTEATANLLISYNGNQLK